MITQYPIVETTWPMTRDTASAMAPHPMSARGTTAMRVTMIAVRSTTSRFFCRNSRHTIAVGTDEKPARNTVTAITWMTVVALGSPRALASHGAVATMMAVRVELVISDRLNTVGAIESASRSPRASAAVVPSSAMFRAMVCATKATARAPNSSGAMMRATMIVVANCSRREAAMFTPPQAEPLFTREASDRPGTCSNALMRYRRLPTPRRAPGRAAGGSLPPRAAGATVMPLAPVARCAAAARVRGSWTAPRPQLLCEVDQRPDAVVVGPAVELSNGEQQTLPRQGGADPLQELGRVRKAQRGVGERFERGQAVPQVDRHRAEVGGVHIAAVNPVVGLRCSIHPPDIPAPGGAQPVLEVARVRQLRVVTAHLAERCRAHHRLGRHDEVPAPPRREADPAFTAPDAPGDGERGVWRRRLRGCAEGDGVPVDQADPRMAFHQRARPGQGAGRQQVVRGNQRDVVGLDQGEPVVVGFDVAGILLVDQGAHPGVVRGQPLRHGRGAVGRSVVHDDDVGRHTGLAEHACHKMRQEVPVVVARDDDRHRGERGHWSGAQQFHRDATFTPAVSGRAGTPAQVAPPGRSARSTAPMPSTEFLPIRTPCRTLEFMPR